MLVQSSKMNTWKRILDEHEDPCGRYEQAKRLKSDTKCSSKRPLENYSEFESCKRSKGVIEQSMLYYTDNSSYESEDYSNEVMNLALIPYKQDKTLNICSTIPLLKIPTISQLNEIRSDWDDKNDKLKPSPLNSLVLYTTKYL